MRKGWKKREPYVYSASVSTSLPREPSSPENNKEDRHTGAQQRLLLHQTCIHKLGKKLEIEHLNIVLEALLGMT